MKDEEIRHNGTIALWKFIYCIMIIIYHTSLHIELNARVDFKYGAIGVEFFFLVSGYLLGKKALNYKNVEKQNLGEETYFYLKNKIKKIYPFIFITYATALPIFIVIRNYKKYNIIASIWELLLMQSSGLYKTHIIAVAWYISAMLLCMLIIYPLILKYRKNFVYIIAPITVFFLWGYIIRVYGNFTNPWEWTGFTIVGVLRAFFEMSFGVILYEISERIRKINFTKLGMVLLNLIESIGFISILFIVNINNANNKYDSIMMLILAISIMIAFSEKTISQKYLNNKFIYFMEKISLPMYLNQIWIIDLLRYFSERISILNSNFYIFCVIVICMDFIVSILDIYVIKLMKKMYVKVKKLFIKTDT